MADTVNQRSHGAGVSYRKKQQPIGVLQQFKYPFPRWEAQAVIGIYKKPYTPKYTRASLNRENK